MKQLNNHFGFTLIEILVAMAIVAIITAALWGNFTSSLIKGRDSRRKQDLDNIAKALELYYNDNRTYPITLPPWGDRFVHPTNSMVVYMQKIPADPATPNATYCYMAPDGTYYQLYANMENTSDPKLMVTPGTCPALSTATYNYGIASSNSTP